MTTEKIHNFALTDIQVGKRFRKTYDLEEGFISSIRSKGIIQPITITPNMELIAGGRRLEGAKLADLETIPCIIREIEGEADLREIELFENIFRKDLTWQERAALEARLHKLKSSTEGWSQRDTAEELGQSVGGLNRRLQLAETLEVFPELGKLEKEADAWKAVKKMEENILLREMERRAAVVDADAIAAAEAAGEEAPPPMVSAFTWAANHYHLGDALEGLRQLNPDIFWFAEVDPPYGIKLGQMKKAEGEVSDMDTYTEVTPEEYPVFVKMVAGLVYRTLLQNSFCIWWFGPTNHQVVYEGLTDAGFTVNPIPAIWYKGGQGQSMQPESTLANCYEPFFVCRKGRPALRKAGRVNVFHYPPVPAGQKIHPTERPMDLMLEIMDTFTWPGTSMVVPFLGSGVTLRAGYQRSYSGIGWDLSDEHKRRFLLRVEEEMGAKVQEDESSDL